MHLFIDNKFLIFRISTLKNLGFDEIRKNSKL